MGSEMQPSKPSSSRQILVAAINSMFTVKYRGCVHVARKPLPTYFWKIWGIFDKRRTHQVPTPGILWAQQPNQDLTPFQPLLREAEASRLTQQHRHEACLTGSVRPLKNWGSCQTAILLLYSIFGSNKCLHYHVPILLDYPNFSVGTCLVF